MSSQLTTLLIVGAVVLGGWCFLAGPCKGKVPEIDKIAQAAQDAIKQFAGSGNPGQGALNSGTNVFGDISDPKQKVVPFTALSPEVQAQQRAGTVTNTGTFLDPIKTGNTGTNAGTFVPGQLLSAKQLQGLYTRANLGEISHFRMSIG